MPQNLSRSERGGSSAAVRLPAPDAAPGVVVAMTRIIAHEPPALTPLSLKAMFHIVLYQPEIPPNTGNIIRLAANCGATLHLVKPLGFELTLRAVRRAGLDYDELAQMRVHTSLSACFEALAGARVFSIETGGGRPYSDAAFRASDAFLFGSETRGLPAEVVAEVPSERQLAIPMCAGNRSLNLSNAVALVIYEAWRQNDFAGAGAPPR